MQTIKLGLAVTAAVLLVLGFGAPALAFHEGGVAHCDGCHTMHFSVDGAAPVFRDGVTVGTANANLTIGSDPSSTCLNCHNGSGSYHVNSSDGTNFTAGGDFFWTRVTYQYTTFSPQESPAEKHGHSIIAVDFPDFQVGDTTPTAPGGSYPSSALGCSSCHDPHGSKTNKTSPISVSGSYGEEPAAGTEAGNYRLLADLGYETAGLTFNGAMPVAVAPGLRDGPERDDLHVDYGSSMSEWCANCHSQFLVPANATKHTTGNNAKLGSEYVGNYNSYAATGNFDGRTVTQANAYFRLVPIERGTDDPSTLSPTNTFGANADSNVSCLTCHRAHASAFDYATRWDMTQELLADSHPQSGDTFIGGTPFGNAQETAYYGENIVDKYGPFQRSLCNKCHLQD